ncbi:site-specific integrase [Pseudomonas sp. USHLN015]|uniref:site-specific integrase n=1 Tax=Pseudomonas sp. USHLN015 TaxID=3081296 RepID=UPI00301BDA0E
MRHTRRIQAALTAFHLDRPDDHWEDLVVPLREKAEQTLLDSIRWEEREAQAVAYSELLEDLGFIRATEPMTADHVKALGMSIKIVQGGLERLLKGNPDPLREVVEELREAEAQLGVPKPTVSPVAPEATSADYMPLSRLAALYMDEQEGNYAEKSVKDMNSSFKVLAEALTDENGVELNMKTHTREDMVNLKKKLLASGRKPLTVNKLLTRLSTLTTWAQNNRYLDNAFNKGLKITKGAESGRKAFSDEQVRLIMSEMARLPKDNWKRWAMSIGVITGARIGEIFQLTKTDVSTIGGITVIDFNDDGDKTLKNSNSRRLVPLVDGAYGFDLKAFLEYVEGCEDKLFDRVSHNFTRVLNETLRDICHHDSGEGLTFHSLRHSLASLMKHRGVQVSIAQDILGHSSQTITFDLYGGDSRLALSKLEEALKESFGV